MQFNTQELSVYLGNAHVEQPVPGIHLQAIS